MLALATGPIFDGAAAAEHALKAAVPRITASVSRSTGLPWDGALTRAARLRASETVRYLPRHRKSRNHYGTSELIGLIRRGATAVADRHPGSRLSVGELSAKRGGWIKGHHSHRNGRDADLAFYMNDPQGKAAQFWRFVAFDRPGKALRVPRKMLFDDARNWTLVASLLSDAQARVQYMFVSKPIRKRLLIEARRRGEPAEFQRAAAAVLTQPKHGNEHADHFHVRIFCSRDDRPGCQDGVPYWPWYDGEPPEGQYAALPTIRWRKR